MEYLSYKDCTQYCKIYGRKIIEDEYIHYYHHESRIMYKILDKPHRTKGPAFIRYNDNGTIDEICYYNHGKLHRKDGPANIIYYANGNILHVGYHINGQPFRVDGPAKIEYYRNGNVMEQRYYRDGQEYKIIFYHSHGGIKWKYGN